jgi:hypothetical protein
MGSADAGTQQTAAGARRIVLHEGPGDPVRRITVGLECLDKEASLITDELG